MKCYNGQKPYIFVSYCHADLERVSPVIEELTARGYRVWYDDAIDPGEEWPEIVASRLFCAESVLFFVSDGFCRSRNCKREVNFSVDKDKDGLAIIIDDAEMSLGLQMQLNSYQSVFYKSGDDITDFITKLLENRILKKPELIMDVEEYNETVDMAAPQSGLVNQMIIAIGVIKHEGKLLMTKRKKNENGLLWGFPTTMIKPDDDMPERIVKEIYMETGAKTSFIRYIGKRVHPNTKAIAYYCALKYESGDVLNKDDYENSDVRWIDVKDYRNYITSDLFEGVKKYVEDDGMAEVVMCIVQHENKVLLVHRKSNDEKLSWVFPGGTVEPGETVEQTAVRELKEETNIDGSVETVIGERVHPKTNKRIAYAALKPRTFEPVLGDDDLDDVRWVEKSELVRLLGGMYGKVAEYLQIGDAR